MLNALRRLMYHFSEEAQRKRREQAMNAYLGQAKDRVHLEQLETQWFKMNGYK